MASAAAVLLDAAPARAVVGTVDLSWDDCSPIQVNKQSSDPGPYAIYVSIMGHDEIVQGYEVWGVLGTSVGTTPDAWQFEVEGCQGFSRVTIDEFPPPEVAAGCPALPGAAVVAQVEGFDPGAHFIHQPCPTCVSPYLPTMRRFVLANRYVTPVVTQPGTRYFLARFLFDHGASTAGTSDPGVTCGGFDESICFSLVPWKTGSVTGLDDTLVPFAIGQGWLTFNDPVNGMGCAPAVPARNRTWGALKAMYRQ
jgi:hypothetical protein